MATTSDNTRDTRTDAEKRYDAERDGTLYLPPALAEAGDQLTPAGQGSPVQQIAAYLAAAFRQGMPTAEGFTQMAQQIELMCTLDNDEGLPPAACELAGDVSITHKDSDWVSCEAGEVTIGFEDEWITLFGAREQHTWDEGRVFFAALDRLLTHPYVRARLGLDPRSGSAHRQAEQPAPAVHVEQWQSEGTEYVDFTAGDELTKVLIGTYGCDKPGIELVIGGTGINERVDKVITLADVRQLRDNLTAILGDPRLAGVVARAEAGAPPAPALTIDRTSFHCRVGAATGTLTAILTGMPRATGERALTLLTDLIGVLDGDDVEADDIPALAV